MALQASGAISMSQIRSEFGGGSGAISFADFYRGAGSGKVRAKQGNNTATNLAANVPTSGAISFSNFYGQARAFRKTYTSGATNQNASTIFGSDFGVNYPKEIVINSGVELGATNTSDEALQINSAGAGLITITNNGTISGAGGSAGGGAGGDAFEATTACTLINNGTIRAGGGGGGAGGSGGTGGTGGQGRTSYTNYSGQINSSRNFSGTNWLEVSGNAAFYFVGWSNYYPSNSNGRVRWYSGTGGRGISFQGMSNSSSGTVNGTMGSVSVQALDGDWNSTSGSITWHYKTITTGYNYYNGGSGGSGGGGGAGGRGQGYNHGSQNGSGGSAGAGGSAGGTNAGAGGQGGTGGTGGNGGGYGASGGNGATGATGNTGANGNHTNGSAGSGGSGGSSGGAAGKYIRGLSNVTFTNNGTVQGGTA